MELRHLRYFVALAGSLNFTRAAERVHVSQSTLSHQIRQLEDEIGQRLFERVGKRVFLTEAGESFIEHAERALSQIDSGLGALKKSPASISGTVRVGATHSFNLEFIPECVARFLKRNPTVHMHVEELSADTIVQRVEAGELDLGIAYRPLQSTHLRFEPLYNEELLFVVNPAHPFARRKRLRMIELHREPLALLTSEFSTRRMLEEDFRACGAEPNVVAEFNTMAAIMQLVARMPISTITAASAVGEATALVLVPLESPTPMRTPGLLLADRTLSRQAQAFLKLLRRQAAS